ncbi:OmpA family protein [Dactylococcopsis salina]|uniref:Flagellar motor protein n=1 Tax=Dactylococcopsis salina (strain PCC 8305) TaxID=13035 RepID=K9YTF5_DACS8|nr:flagellar motor protein [Dactylococcopsis salina]AFZ50169.1 flagellar motor protein [Dactylococcopsis salina PCC 8305]
MLKRKRYWEEETEETNIWTSFTDLMSNAFMILSLLLFITLIRLFLITQENQQLKKELEQGKETPPILIIQDSGEFKFQSGSAVLPSPLKTYIRNTLVDKIEEITAGNQTYSVEIIGHTDGQILGGGNSNLDRNLEKVANGNLPITELQPGSNADLGLMRSLAVVKELQGIKAQGRLQNLQFHAYSAAQLFLPNSQGFAAVDRAQNSSRRRIEIRFSPLGEAEVIR